jgi:hypothetical protein
MTQTGTLLVGRVLTDHGAELRHILPDGTLAVECSVDVRLDNSSQLAGFAKAKDLPYVLRELVGASYEHEPVLAPTQQMLDAYRKQKGDWSSYEAHVLRAARA